MTSISFILTTGCTEPQVPPPPPPPPPRMSRPGCSAVRSPILESLSQSKRYAEHLYLVGSSVQEEID